MKGLANCCEGNYYEMRSEPPLPIVVKGAVKTRFVESGGSMSLIGDMELRKLAQQQSIAAANASGGGEEDDRLYFQYPWITPPPGFEPFDYQGQITTPAKDGLDHVVLSILMPRGWDGVVRRLSHNYTGGGFTSFQGSGAIAWRLLADKRAIRNYDNILFEFGSPQQARPTDGILLYENQLVEYVVNLDPLSLFIPSQATMIICTLAGWIWPRRNR